MVFNHIYGICPNIRIRTYIWWKNQTYIRICPKPKKSVMLNHCSRVTQKRWCDTGSGGVNPCRRQCREERGMQRVRLWQMVASRSGSSCKVGGRRRRRWYQWSSQTRWGNGGRGGERGIWYHDDRGWVCNVQHSPQGGKISFRLPELSVSKSPKV